MKKVPVGVITGATSGVGRAAAIGLAGYGVRLHLLGRNATAGERLARQICRREGDGAAMYHCTDLAEWDTVRRTADMIGNAADSIDFLVLAAGARHDTRLSNSVGVEMTFAANHLGHFLLTALLLDKLLDASSARVITVSSGSHTMAKADQSEWTGRHDPYDRRQVYAGSKLANVLFAYELARRLRETSVVSNAYDPGGVISGFARNNGLKSWLRHVIAEFLHGDISFPKAAATGLVRLALDPDAALVNGRYFRRSDERRSSSDSYDPDLARKLWSESVKLVSLDASVGPSWHCLKPEDPALAMEES